MSHNEKMHSVHSTPAIKKCQTSSMLFGAESCDCQSHSIGRFQFSQAFVSFSVSLLFIYFFLVLFVHLTSPKYLALCMLLIGTKPLLVMAHGVLYTTSFKMVLGDKEVVCGDIWFTSQKDFSFYFPPSLPIGGPLASPHMRMHFIGTLH